MKKLLTLGLLLFLALKTFAQTEGISYQAVIIGPDALELPGVDSEGNYLPLADIIVKFSIIAPGSGVIVFSETQDTTTDEYGRINLIIGQGNYDDFEKIYWDDTPKSLEVEIDFNDGNGFVLLSTEKLTYVPYVQHRAIKASDSLVVDGNTTLKGELNVLNQPTNLGGIFNVNGGNTSNLSGDLNVDGATNLFAAVTVGEFNGTPDADAPTLLNGSLDVKGKSTFGALESETLRVTDSTELNGTFIVNSNTPIQITSTLNDDDDTDINSYPLKIQGGKQGIAIVVNEGRNNDNNFISFWDNTTSSSPANSGADVTTTNPTMWGRIEGETPDEFGNNADHVFTLFQLSYDTASSLFDVATALSGSVVAVSGNVAAATSTTVVVGPVPGVTLPIPSFNVSTKVELVATIAEKIAAGLIAAASAANLVWYNVNKDKFQGVTYASGAGDYAEYLLRQDINEEMTYGDIVGVNGGEISKNLNNAERILVISYKPIVLGNMPQPNREAEYEKVAFMGQVPVKVFGRVNIGDYILPSGKNDGIGIAVAPNEIAISQIKNIVGTAWSINLSGFGLVNVAVGLNRNDSSLLLDELDKKVNTQAEEISYLKNQIESILVSIANIENGNISKNQLAVVSSISKSSIDKVDEETIAYVAKAKELAINQLEITEQDIEEAMAQAEKMLNMLGKNDIADEFFNKIRSDNAYKKTFMNKIYKEAKTELQYQKDLILSAEKHK